MNANTTAATVQEKFRSLAPIMNEKMRRRWAASEALAFGWGGITLVAQATGLSPVTIRQGIAEMTDSATAAPDEAERCPRIRRPGGGRKRLSASDRTLRKDL